MKQGLFLSYDSDQHDYKKIFYDPIFKKLENYKIQIECVSVGKPDKKNETNEKIIAFKKSKVGKIIGLIQYYILLEKKLKKNYDFIISRSLIPSFIFLLLHFKLKKIPIIYDCDGLMHLERVENGLLHRKSPVFKMFCWVHNRMLKISDFILVRTNNAKKIICRSNIKYEKKIFLFSNGRNPKLFFPRKKFNKKKLNIVYSGSLGPQYLPSKMIKIFKYLRTTNLNPIFSIYCSNLNCLSEQFIKKCQKEEILLKKTSAENIPKIIRQADIAFNLRRSSLSTKAVFPIKVSEYLLSGVPVISSANIGDLDEMQIPKSCFQKITNIDKNALLRVYKFCRSVLNHRKRCANKCRTIGLKKFSETCSVNQLFTVIQKIYTK